jgi:hypothetical protein
MRRFAVLSFIIALLTVPIRVQAQEPLPEGWGIGMTREMSDCALDLIKFKTAVVMGIDLIEVTEETRQIWRNYLAVYLTKLAPADQYEYGPLACSTLTNVTAMSPLMRENYRETWSSSLSPVLQFLEPVLRAAQQLRASKEQSRAVQQLRAERLRAAEELQLRVAEELRAAEQLRRQNAARIATREVEAVAEIQRRLAIGNTLLNFNRSFYGH